MSKCRSNHKSLFVFAIWTSVFGLALPVYAQEESGPRPDSMRFKFAKQIYAVEQDRLPREHRQSAMPQARVRPGSTSSLGLPSTSLLTNHSTIKPVAFTSAFGKPMQSVDANQSPSKGVLIATNLQKSVQASRTKTSKPDKTRRPTQATRPVQAALPTTKSYDAGYEGGVVTPTSFKPTINAEEKVTGVVKNWKQ